jgi:hypothetical protein
MSKAKKEKFNLILEETLLEVTESKQIRIKQIGRILVDYGVNNIENINYISKELKKQGIIIIKG